jgi:hypothetical protein
MVGIYRNKANFTLMAAKYRNESKYHTNGREIQELPLV